MNNKGFILLDSLIVVVIVTNMCLLCFSVYRAISADEIVSERFRKQENEFYSYLFAEYSECEVCEIDESD